MARFVNSRMTRKQRQSYGDRLGFLDSDDWGDDQEFGGLAKSFKLEVLAAVVAALVGPDAGEERPRPRPAPRA